MNQWIKSSPFVATGASLHGRPRADAAITLIAPLLRMIRSTKRSTTRCRDRLTPITERHGGQPCCRTCRRTRLPNPPIYRSRRLRYAPPRPAALAPGCGPGGRPGTARRASTHDPMIGQAHRQHHGARREPSSSAYQCPSRGHRVKGAYGVARDRFATLDPPTAHQGFSAYEEDRGAEQLGGAGRDLRRRRWRALNPR